MILRRLAENLRRRDWFTVLMEIVIVVVGVFIGIEVANWNEDRQNRALAESHLERLSSDLTSEVVAWDDVLQYFRTTRQHAFSALQGFEAPLEELDAGFLVDLYQASQERNHSIRTPTYDELVTTGNIEYLPDPALREVLSVHYDLSERIEQVFGERTDYRPILRQHMNHLVQQAIVNACGDTYVIHPNGYRGILLPETCDIELPEDQVKQELRRLHGSELLQQHLRYQFSNLGSRIQSMESMLHGTHRTLAAVTDATGANP